MPISRSPNRYVKPAAGRRAVWPLVLLGLIGLAAVLAVVVASLPASAIAHFLPQYVRAEDFSGGIWHGSAGKLIINGRDAGALEWRLHPAAFLGAALAADLHWVKVGMVVDGAVKIDRHGFELHDLKGSGPIEDLHDLGVAQGWRGTADIDFSTLRGDFVKGDLPKPVAAVGHIQVSNLASVQIAGGAPLGGYDLRLAENAVGPDGTVSARLVDTGGPLELQTLIHYSANERTGLSSGTLRERADAPAALRSQIEELSQLRGRDAQGRIPVDLEFRF
jgi:hypothetical protein